MSPFTFHWPVRRAIIAILACGFAWQSPAQTMSVAPGATAALAYKAPATKKIESPTCNQSSVTTRAQVDPEPGCQALQMIGFGTEGWVLLNFMVSSHGKPYEIAVTQSTGNKILEQTAVVAIGKSSFEPATAGGRPVDSGFEFKYAFSNPTFKVTADATKEFIDTYKALTDAINAGNQSAADAAMLKLKIVNLSEDAYVGVAKYSYAIKWGSESDQLAGLQRAIANEKAATYLPADLFKRVLLARIRLELKSQQFAEAQTTWATLQSLGIDAEAAAVLQPAMDRLQKMRGDNSAYDVMGTVSDGAWHLHLFKRHFRAVVEDGSLSQIKLRCERQFEHFAFDPKAQYEVATNDGACTIELDGASGTHFKLTQF